MSLPCYSVLHAYMQADPEPMHPGGCLQILVQQEGNTKTQPQEPNPQTALWAIHHSGGHTGEDAYKVSPH